MPGRTIMGVRFDFVVIAKAIAAVAVLFLLGNLPAKALPSYARQTGQPCGTCHTDFAGLTPYGRLFKIQGYTAGGGAYRSTLFPDGSGAKPYVPPLLAESLAVENASKPDSSDPKPYAPPLSMMTVVGFTHAATSLGPPSASAPFNGNNNIALDSVNFMYGGAIADHIGAFAQVSYNGQPAGGFSGGSPYNHSWNWDNTDVRFADSANIGGINVTYGITANNNPTVQDPWNTTPAWSFPYVSSPLAQVGPPNTPIIDGAFAQNVVSLGAYTFVNDALYVEASVYTTLNPNTQIALGTDPFASPGLFDAAPYWRVAYEPHWGNHWLEFGTFGMYAAVHPWNATTPTDTSTSPLTDKYTDVGFDTQYQYQGSNFWVTLRGSYIYEYQKLDATFFNGGSNPSNTLNEARAYASLAYGNNNRVVLTGQYFTSWGSPDVNFYGTPNGSPNAKGFIAEIAYIPFISSFSPGWPWFNARVGLQYTAYTEFNGTSVGASANNSLYLYLWMAM